jgi:hypothetical protein
VYRMDFDVGMRSAGAASVGTGSPATARFDDRRAIAVLPFTNFGGDADQEYFADGITEDIISLLAGWRAFPVIARNSTFNYKGNTVDVSGSFARGFFVWNSEVGKTTLGAGFFLFDYVCCNRITWGADHYTEVCIRHTKGAPDRWLEEVTPVLREYSQASAKPVVQAIEDARSKRIDDELSAFLAKRFAKQMAPAIMAVHEQEEGRPIETLWDVTVAATAHARSVKNTDSGSKSNALRVSC